MGIIGNEFRVEILEPGTTVPMTETPLLKREAQLTIVPPPPAERLAGALAIGSIYYNARPVFVHSIVETPAATTLRVEAFGKDISEPPTYLDAFARKVETYLNVAPEDVLKANVALMNGTILYDRVE